MSVFLKLLGFLGFFGIAGLIFIDDSRAGIDKFLTGCVIGFIWFLFIEAMDVKEDK